MFFGTKISVIYKKEKKHLSSVCFFKKIWEIENSSIQISANKLKGTNPLTVECCVVVCFLKALNCLDLGFISLSQAGGLTDTWSCLNIWHTWPFWSPHVGPGLLLYVVLLIHVDLATVCYRKLPVGYLWQKGCTPCPFWNSVYPRAEQKEYLTIAK